MVSNLSYNGQQVYDYDHDRFLTALFAPASKREALFALYAFNHEIAKTRDVVTDAMIGQIRLQWWRDGIGKLYAGEISEHEIFKGLAPVIDNLDPKDFHDLIDARELDFVDEAPETLDDLIAYATKTTTPLTHLACQILGEDADQHLIKDVSIAYALTGILRSAPYHVGQGRFMLPLDLLKKHDVSPTTLTDKNFDKKLKPVVEGVCSKILEYIDNFKGKKPNSAMLIGVIARHYVHAIQRNDFNIFIEIKKPLMILPLAWAKFSKRL